MAGLFACYNAVASVYNMYLWLITLTKWEKGLMFPLNLYIQFYKFG